MTVTKPSNDYVDYSTGGRTITDVIDIYEAEGDNVRASLYKVMRQTLKDMRKTIKTLQELVEDM